VIAATRPACARAARPAPQVSRKMRPVAQRRSIQGATTTGGRAEEGAVDLPCRAPAPSGSFGKLLDVAMTVSRPEETPRGTSMTVSRAPAPFLDLSMTVSRAPEAVIDPSMTVPTPPKTAIDLSMALLGAPETLDRGQTPPSGAPDGGWTQQGHIREGCAGHPHG
jgi:hypothetical protein